MDGLAISSGLLFQQCTPGWEEGGSKHRVGRTTQEERGLDVLEGSFCQDFALWSSVLLSICPIATSNLGLWARS